MLKIFLPLYLQYPPYDHWIRTEDNSDRENNDDNLIDRGNLTSDDCSPWRLEENMFNIIKQL